MASPSLLIVAEEDNPTKLPSTTDESSFSEKLMDVIQSNAYSNAIWWLAAEEGYTPNAFAIHKANLEATALKDHFRRNKVNSFIRILHKK